MSMKNLEISWKIQEHPRDLTITAVAVCDGKVIAESEPYTLLYANAYALCLISLGNNLNTVECMNEIHEPLFTGLRT